jgi:hypothetical protein
MVGRRDLGTNFACALALLVAPIACDSGGEGSESTPFPTGGDDGDATEGSEPTLGDDGGDDDGGPPDTDGDPSPPVECGDGTHTGSILINPEDPSGVPVETLDGIAILDGDLLISSTSYQDLNFLSCLREVRGDIQIYGNYFLEDMSGTDGITKVGRLPAPNPTPNDPNFVDEGKGSITISNNPLLTDIDGFNGITQVGERDPADPENESSQSLVIRSNDALVTLSGFSNLQIIFESLVIQENPVLKDIDGLRGLRVVDGFFSVTRNPSLCMSSVAAVGTGLDFLGDVEHSTDTLNDEGC